MNRQTYEEWIFAPILPTLSADKAEFDKRVEEIHAQNPILTSKEGMVQFVRLAGDITEERIEALRQRQHREHLSQKTLNRLVLDYENRRFYLTQLTVRTMVAAIMRGMEQPTVDSVTAPQITEFLDMLSVSFTGDAVKLGMTNEEGSGLAVTQVVHHYAIAHHALTGKPTFVTSPGLTEALIHTEFRDVPSDMLKLPHEVLSIEPPRNVGLQIPDVQSGLHEVVNIFVLTRGVRSVGQTWHVVLVGEDKGFSEEEERIFAYNDALFHFHFRFDPELTVGQLIAKHVAEVSEWVQATSGMTATGWTEEHLERILRYVINTLLYVTLPDAELQLLYRDPEVEKLHEKLSRAPKGSHKREKLNGELRSKSKDRVTLLGSTVKLMRRAHDTAPGAGGGDGTKLYVQHIRRGHWRNQAHGPEHSLRRLMWIKPMMVGPKDSPLKITTYEVT